MARGRRGTMEDLPETAEVEPVEDVQGEDLDVEILPEDPEEETVAEGDEATEKEAKPKKEKARGDLPEGYVTPVGLAKELTRLGLGKDGGDVPPQMVYSYIKNAPK